MKVIHTNTNAFYFGEGPLDLGYTVEQEVLLDDNSTVFVQIQALPTGELFYAVNTVSLFAQGEVDINKPLEMYHDLGETAQSVYANNFKELDKVLDDKIQETMEQLDDTALCGGVRFGARFEKQLHFYAEGVAYLSKEEKYIYLQINREGDKTEYSVADTSIFMRMELGDFYPAYYDYKPNPTPLIKTDNLDKLGEYAYLKDDFADLEKKLSEKQKEIEKEAKQ